MNVYEARHAGREYCNTEGGEHYKGGEVEPLDLIIAKGLQDGFCIGNMLKYATRFQQTRNLDDLKKVSDYAHILCGVELSKHLEENFLVAKDFESIAKAEKLCRERYLANRCEDCPIAEEHEIMQLSCREYIEHYTHTALDMLQKDFQSEGYEPGKVWE